MPEDIMCGLTDDPEIAQMKKIGEFDVDAGLALVGGSEKIYKSTLRIIAKKIPSLTQTMGDSLENGDLVNFNINIHSIKSSLAAAGARALSREALDMELASKAGNEDFCKKMFPGFAGRLLDLGEKLRPIFALADDDAEQAQDSPRLENRLAAIESFLEEFDGDAALEILATLIKCDFGQEINELLTALNEQVEMFEYEDAKISLAALQKLILLP